MTSQRTQWSWYCFGLFWFLALFCTKNISAIAMICNIELHIQCIWSVETESNGRRSCFFKEPYICPLNYLLHYDCANVHETKSLLDHQKTFSAVSLFQRRFMSQSRTSTGEKGNKIRKFAWTLNTDQSQRQPLLLNWLIPCNTALYKTAKFFNSNDL